MTPVEKLATASIALAVIEADGVLESLPLPQIAIQSIHAGMEVAFVVTTATLVVKAASAGARWLFAPRAKTAVPTQSQTPTPTVAPQTAPPAPAPASAQVAPAPTPAVGVAAASQPAPMPAPPQAPAPTIATPRTKPAPTAADALRAMGMNSQ
jgi:hypothetical protein